MKYSLKHCKINEQATDCIIVGVFSNNTLTTPAKLIDTVSKNAIQKILDQGALDKALGSIVTLYNISQIKAHTVMLVRLGEKAEYNDVQFIKTTKSALNAINKNCVTVFNTLCEVPIKTRDSFWQIRQTILLSEELFYKFNSCKTKSKNDTCALKEIIITTTSLQQVKANKEAIAQGIAISEGMKFAKDLGNLPPNIRTPSYIAKQAKSLANKSTVVKVFDEPAIKKLKMHAFLAVSQGSDQPPKLIVAHYNGGKKNQKPIVLVGKGVTFDSGGISIKPAIGMSEMKYDMMGAASVLGTLKTAALLKLRLNIIGIIPTCENLINGKALKPSDIITSMSGQTIEVNNTDAEGRLLLCDALTYSQQFKPELIIDIATLTGAMVMALGSAFTGVFSKDDTLSAELVKAGKEINDPAWPMPLHDIYDDDLRSECADMSNIGASRTAGACVAAQFLARFVNTPHWAHLDIAGSAFPSSGYRLTNARPIPLLTQFLLNYEKNFKL